MSRGSSCASLPAPNESALTARPFSQAIWGGVGFVIFIGLIRQLLTHFVLPRHPQFLSKTSAFLDRNFFLVSRIRGHRIFWSGWKMSELVPIQIFNIANLVTIFVPYRHTVRILRLRSLLNVLKTNPVRRCPIPCGSYRSSRSGRVD